MSWHLYILRCNDESLYAGITTDVSRRIQEHNASPKGARYTKARRPVTLITSWPFENRSQATKAELRFKKLSTKRKKEAITKDQPIF